MCTEKYWQDSFPTVVGRIEYIFKQKLFTDFVINVYDNDTVKVFNVHKVFLASVSPFFESALFGPVGVKTDSMILEDINSSAFEDLLSYMYTDGQFLKDITQAINIYMLADRFLMENVKVMCREFIVKNVDSRTVCQVIEYFRVHNDQQIILACQKVIMDNTTSLILSKEFEQVSLETLLMVLKLDRLKIKSETQLCKTAERWLEAEISRKGIEDESEKRKLFYDVIQNVRFKSISPDEFPHSTMFSKYMDSEDKQKILNSMLSGNDGALMPEKFSQKKREFIKDQIPLKSVIDTISSPLPSDWKQRLHANVVRGDIKNLKHLVRAGADVKVKYNNGTTLLHIAAHRCKLEVVKCLIDQGIPVNAIDGSGYTALHIAALWGKLEIVQLLLDRGADPKMTNTDGQTPLDIANAQPHACHREIRDVILSRMSS